jgi:hypothetical protein
VAKPPRAAPGLAARGGTAAVPRHKGTRPTARVRPADRPRLPPPPRRRPAVSGAAPPPCSRLHRAADRPCPEPRRLRVRTRAADERCAFYEDGLEELRDTVLLREREVDGYRRLLGLAPEDGAGGVVLTDELRVLPPRDVVVAAQRGQPGGGS